jgi:hypothetical protein
MTNQESWFDEPVARGRSPLRQRDRVAVVVSALLLFCLTLLLIVGALAGGGPGDRPGHQAPDSAVPSGNAPEADPGR